MRPATFSTGEILGRTFDPAQVNPVINDPAVRPFVGDPTLGVLDISYAVERPENIFLMGDHGGFGLTWTAPFTYEVHTFILKTGRGAWARQSARETIQFAASQGATMLWTKIAPDQPNVEAFATEMGMLSCGMVIETLGKPYAVFAMEAVCQ